MSNSNGNSNESMPWNDEDKDLNLRFALDACAKPEEAINSLQEDVNSKNANETINAPE